MIVMLELANELFRKEIRVNEAVIYCDTGLGPHRPGLEVEEGVLAVVGNRSAVQNVASAQRSISNSPHGGRLKALRLTSPWQTLAH